MQLPDRLLKAIRKQELLKPGDRIAAAVSGGSDSVALLLLLLELRSELGIVLSAAHVNHKLRGDESDADERFVEELCALNRLELHSCTAPVESRQSGIEAAARQLRYQYFQQLAESNTVSKIATGHTLDDQAETVLLRILRGTGIRGLAGIHPRIVLEEQGAPLGEVVRPLLGFRRAELQDFLRHRSQSWREDSTNQDPKFLRNRVRHNVLPLLTENFGSPVVENLADLAEIARAEEEHWAISHPEIRTKAGELPIDELLSLSLAARRRLIRAWIDTQSTPISTSFHLIEECLDLACSNPAKVLEIGAGQQIRRTRDGLAFESCENDVQQDYEYSLRVPGEVTIPELGIRIQASIVNTDDVPDSDRLCLLLADRCPAVLTVRNWRPGDRFWPAHTSRPKKVKELLSDKYVSGKDKKLWPVIVAGNELVWVRSFGARSDLLPQKSAGPVIWIREHQFV